VYHAPSIHQLTSRSRPDAGRRPLSESDRNVGVTPLLRKVLLVDDEQDLADMAAFLLQARGLEVLVAYSAHEALQMLQKDGGVDAIVSDIMMPGMTGLQLADAVRELFPNVKIVLTSGYTLPASLMDRERPYLYTPKPYQIETILKLLHT
jgi:two-component system OmpR family response regulator